MKKRDGRGCSDALLREWKNIDPGRLDSHTWAELVAVGHPAVTATSKPKGDKTPTRRPATTTAVTETSGPCGPWTVTITGWQPVLLNKLMHAATRGSWAVKKLKAKDRHELDKHTYWIPRAKGKRRVTLTWIGRGKPDDDNCWKSLLDGMVALGLLRDDSPEWKETEKVRYERGPKGVRLTIEDC